MPPVHLSHSSSSNIGVAMARGRPARAGTRLTDHKRCNAMHAWHMTCLFVLLHRPPVKHEFAIRPEPTLVDNYDQVSISLIALINGTNHAACGAATSRVQGELFAPNLLDFHHFNFFQDPNLHVMYVPSSCVGTSELTNTSPWIEFFL